MPFAIAIAATAIAGLPPEPKVRIDLASGARTEIPAGYRPVESEDARTLAIAAHFDVIIGAVRAGRAELVRLHQANWIDNETLRNLDLEEMGALASKG